jgi:hypothetical protein
MAFQHADAWDAYHRHARQNLARWREQTAGDPPKLAVEVIPGDWGEVTRMLTAKHGEMFAVLNMANPHVPGGAYVEGAVAQEENMFRRTDCHFRIDESDYDAQADCYKPHMTRLLMAEHGRVYLDVLRPRVCIRGPEDRTRSDLGYTWMDHEDFFPFYELRAAAQDMRGGMPFSEAEARRRIAAQFETLQAHRVRHVVFGAFGCGAFRNPSDIVARIYRDEIQYRSESFSVVAFAIFHAGYGPDNYAPFQEAMSKLSLG